MKKGYTHIVCITDKSGSMHKIKNDTIGGFNNFVKTQRDLPNTATITHVLFSNDYNIVADFVDINRLPDLDDITYNPSGSTALYDVLCEIIDKTGKHLAQMNEKDRPEKVIVAILTDGEENSSTKYKQSDAFERIKHQQDVYKWDFTYLGANQDVFAVGASLGIMRSATYSYVSDGPGTVNAFNKMSSYVCSSRTGDSTTYN